MVAARPLLSQTIVYILLRLTELFVYKINAFDFSFEIIYKLLIDL
jgi:hypothetical protein